MLFQSQFDAEKAVEVIVYVASRIPDPSFHSISKLMYLADQEHLQNYGRLICGDSYVAMKHGPVPTKSYDIMKDVKNGGGLSSFTIHAANAFSVVSRYHISPSRDADISLLSRSDIKCLDRVIHEHGSKSFQQLTDMTHDAAWNSADENEFIELEAIVDMLPNKESLSTFLSSKHNS